MKTKIEDQSVKQILEDAEEFLEGHEVDVELSIDDFKTLLVEEITSDDNYTISMHYSDEDREIVMSVKGQQPKIHTKKATGEEYLTVCNHIGIYENNDYNDSVSTRIDGVLARIFAITKPAASFPNITISTVKEPPTEWDDPVVIEIIKKHLLNSDRGFIVVGGSGAGKTYFMNFLLGLMHGGTDEKILIVEEFSELIAANKSTSKLIVPPTKPTGHRLLAYIAEQSNLMRLEHLYIGEIKGAEAWPFILNLSSGTRGGATIHGDSARQGVKRLEMLAQLAEVPEPVIQNAISKSIEYVVYLKNRKIHEIGRLTGTAMGGNYAIEEIYHR